MAYTMKSHSNQMYSNTEKKRIRKGFSKSPTAMNAPYLLGFTIRFL